MQPQMPLQLYRLNALTLIPESRSWSNSSSQLPSTWLMLMPPAMSPPELSSMPPKPKLQPECTHYLPSPSPFMLEQLPPRTVFPQSKLVKDLQMGSLPLPSGHQMSGYVNTANTSCAGSAGESILEEHHYAQSTTLAYGAKTRDTGQWSAWSHTNSVEGTAISPQGTHSIATHAQQMEHGEPR
jgi:hypothetical protein